MVELKLKSKQKELQVNVNFHGAHQVKLEGLQTT
jgi:hypothetical protein